MINMDVKGTGAVAKHLEQIAARSLDAGPAFEAVTDKLIVAEKRLFASKTRIKADKDATKARKARSKDPRVRGNAANALKATGALEKALTTRGPGAQPARLTRDELVFGVLGGRSDMHYARYQAKHGRDPLVSRAVVLGIAKPVLADYITAP